MSREVSALERARLEYRPHLPDILSRGLDEIGFVETEATSSVRDEESIRERFPHTFGRAVLQLDEGPGPENRRALTVGVVLSGGQAPGGHNVITGLFDALQKVHSDSRLLGFLGGPRGILEGDCRELTAEVLAPYRNTGGFDVIGGGRDKIETDDQLSASRATCEKLGLDGLVIIGGDDSNTNAAILSEYFVEHGVETVVTGVPKTIDGDMKGSGVETSFGFDTATKVYSELIGNICRDAASARKYWHFIKLMGRNASHVALECGLRTRANITLIGEEIQEMRATLEQVVEAVALAVKRRAQAGRNYGVCIVPEGLIEFIPEIRVLIGELNTILHEDAKYFETIKLFSDKQEFVNRKLSRDSSYAFSCLPARIQQQLLLERDSHGNVQVSRIDTEAMLVEQVEERVEEWTAKGEFPGKFQVQSHFFGYEGRSAAPSNFDADYTYALGHLAATLIAFGKTGYICAVQNLAEAPGRWAAAGVPLTSLMQMELRKGRSTPVIGKALVLTDGRPFRLLRSERAKWEAEDHYVFPGAIQYFGSPGISGQPTMTLMLEHGREPVSS
jgi:pyrophosphate--fructose-6-phosphate 1-phosphotransferase